MSKSHTREILQQVSERETAVILNLLKETARIPGGVVELGCYRGDTSLLLERMLEKDIEFSAANMETVAPNKRLWIYDSFEGLPEKSAFDNSVAGDNFRAGELAVTKREVVERFKKAGLRVPRIRKGYFENLTTADLPEKISFAFLDGDLYQSILKSLRLVWDKMEKGGIIAIHDYNNPELPGVTKAVDEWIAGHPCKWERRESLAIVRL